MFSWYDKLGLFPELRALLLMQDKSCKYSSLNKLLFIIN
jgi:hypothetical protein